MDTDAAVARHRDAGAAAEALITARQLSVTINRHAVVDRVDLDVWPGEIVTVIGPNGAGKTTLVKALIGLIPPSAGTIVRRRNLSIGYLPQRLVFDPVLPLTVRRLMTLASRRPPAAIAEALAETGVGDLSEAFVHTLSGGEMQRVLLARALLAQPDLLVLDEPAQGVDYIGEAAVYELVARIRDRRGCGVLMVSHDLHVVMAAADRVICLNRHICCAGVPRAVGNHPEYARLFGPLARKALAMYEHHHDHEHDLTGDVRPMAGAAARAVSDDPVR